MNERSLRIIEGDGIQAEPPDMDALRAGVPCCKDLRIALEDTRPSIRYEAETRTVYLLDALPSSGMTQLRYCFCCGAPLLHSLDGERDELALEAGLDPYDDETRDERRRRFGTDRWWRAMLDRDPASFLVALPRPGDVLAIGDGGTQVLVVAVNQQHQFEQFLIARLSEAAQKDPWLTITSSWAYSRGRWPVVGRDRPLAAALGGRITFNHGGWPSDKAWERVEHDTRERAEPVAAGEPLAVDEAESWLYSVEVERLMTGRS